MAFSPNEFVSNINSKGGLARSNLYAVVIPIPTYINNFVTYTITDAIENFGNNLVNSFVDPITSFVNQVLGRGPIDEQSRTSNANMVRELALLCENAEFPGKSFMTHDARVYGPTYKVPYMAQYSEMNLTFLCTNQFQERAFFDRWMEAIVPVDTNNPRFPKSDKSRYMTNIRIIKYDDTAQEVYIVELQDAFPIGMSPQQMSWQDDGFLRLTVQFSYQFYKVIFQGGFDPSQQNLTNFGLGR
jgi:hypothetical protein